MHAKPLHLSHKFKKVYVNANCGSSENIPQHMVVFGPCFDYRKENILEQGIRKGWFIVYRLGFTMYHPFSVNRISSDHRVDTAKNQTLYPDGSFFDPSRG